MRLLRMAGACLLLCLLASCDDGRLYADRLIVPEEGRVARLIATVDGLDTWSDAYSVVLAGFDESSEYAKIAKSVQADSNGVVDLVLAGIDEDVTVLELCVINRIRKRVATYSEWDCSALQGDTLRLDAGILDVGMFSTIQHDIFDRTCIGCHGEGRWLDLSEGASHATLVGQPSSVVEGAMRVQPGNASESILYTILTTNLSADMATDHQTQFTLTDEQFVLIEDWINSGAGE